MDYKYQPNFCEENVWQLACEPFFQANETYVVFASNMRDPSKSIEVYRQRGSAIASQKVLWDYHVFLLSRHPDNAFYAWDFDTTMGFPVPAAEYLDCYRSKNPENQAAFRIVPRLTYINEFGSDRKDIKSPPPSWPRIQPDRSNLHKFRDVTCPFLGDVCSLERMLSRMV